MLAGDHGSRRLARDALLAWYDGARRDLPWRHRRDAYAIWVSEVMLQQTRAETVVRYYDRFLERFPDVATLAAATADEVLAAWSGLGYYRRARSLHAAARAVAIAGSLPREAREWAQLPGIGEYSAAAIASIADGEVIAALDGNVERVTSRLVASREDARRAATRRKLRKVATQLVDPRRPGDSNQALMELGATICRPRAPRCRDCPLRPWCTGFASGAPERFPAARQRGAVERVRRQVFVATLEDRILLFRRPAEASVMAGFWELPWTESPQRENQASHLNRKYGGVWHVGKSTRRVRHTITRRRFSVYVYPAVWLSDGVGEPADGGWYRRSELADLATSSLVLKALGDPIPAGCIR